MILYLSGEVDERCNPEWVLGDHACVMDTYFNSRIKLNRRLALILEVRAEQDKAEQGS